MNNNEMQELIIDVGEKIMEKSQLEFFDFLNRLGFPEEDGRVPLEVWRGISQGLADASGYRVVLQAEILDQDAEDPNILRSVGRRDIASADPTRFVTPAYDYRGTND